MPHPSARMGLRRGPTPDSLVPANGRNLSSWILGLSHMSRKVALELTRSRGHLILGKTPEEGARSGSSVDLSRGVPA